MKVKDTYMFEGNSKFLKPKCKYCNHKLDYSQRYIDNLGADEENNLFAEIETW